ncbi:hypothetical protein G5I_07567 [Acromyrmex echinatior]|uniref:Uncharacterized protein n=1 Tax=Acromyrmex echinatior TaxID=103372 RepID=F4WP57_ACREC|nr:hypothetical protein G5I_07567 [Acromyrmex echinatior]
MEEVAWHPCRRVPHASLTTMESMRFPSLRVVNNDDGDDNEAIYRHAFAHVLVDVRRFESFREFAIFTRNKLARERTVSPLAMKDLDRSCQLFLFAHAKSACFRDSTDSSDCAHQGISSTIDDTTPAEIQPHKRQFAYFAKRVAWVTSASGSLAVTEQKAKDGKRNLLKQLWLAPFSYVREDRQEQRVACVRCGYRRRSGGSGSREDMEHEPAAAAAAAVGEKMLRVPEEEAG